MKRNRVHFHIHPFAAAGLFLLFAAMPRTYAFAAVSSVLLHEAGHMTAALLLDKRVTEIRLMPVGISIGLSAAASYREEFLIAAAGPFISLLYAGVAFFLDAAGGRDIRLLTFPVFSCAQSAATENA